MEAGQYSAKALHYTWIVLYCSIQLKEILIFSFVFLDLTERRNAKVDS